MRPTELSTFRDGRPSPVAVAFHTNFTYIMCYMNIHVSVMSIIIDRSTTQPLSGCWSTELTSAYSAPSLQLVEMFLRSIDICLLDPHTIPGVIWPTNYNSVAKLETFQALAPVGTNLNVYAFHPTRTNQLLHLDMGCAMVCLRSVASFSDVRARQLWRVQNILNVPPWSSGVVHPKALVVAEYATLYP